MQMPSFQKCRIFQPKTPAFKYRSPMREGGGGRGIRSIWGNTGGGRIFYAKYWGSVRIVPPPSTPLVTPVNPEL
jgi:hypothetical protein